MRALLVALALALLGGCAGGEIVREAGAPPSPAPRALADLPWRELWTGVVFQGRKIGFAHLTLRPVDGAPGDWEIESESALRLRFLGVDKRVSLHALDRVRDDLVLERFRYDYELDGSVLRLEGEREGGALRVRIDQAGTRRELRLEDGAAALPENALALLPVLRGLRPGDTLHARVFVGEAQSLEDAELRVEAYERNPLFDGPAVRVRTTLLGLETETWLDADGRPRLERALQGAMVSSLETPEHARAYLVEASLNKDEALLDFSLLRSPPVAEPRRTAALSIVLADVPPALHPPETGGQHCERRGPRLACRIDRRASRASAEPAPAEFLRPTLAAPSNERPFVDLARSIAGDARDDDARIARLLAWIEANIAQEAIDAFSAADVLRERRGECQGHAYLFAAFARALGMPTRVVNGIVYAEPQGGFLYHSWNEVWIRGEGWRPVDATFDQPLADATHLALAVGEGAAELAPLAGMVGRARIASLGGAERW
ncbi:MAG: transglutaminase-like domain-containing protein [Burkholderiales bacterium]